MISVAVAFLAGIVSAPWPGIAVGAALAVGVIACALRASVTQLCVVCVAFVVGLCDASLQTEPAFVYDRRMTTLHAVVVEARAIDEAQTTFVARVADGRRASFTLHEPPLPIGERLTLRAKREPFDDARNPGEPAQREIEAERGVAFSLVHPP